MFLLIAFYIDTDARRCSEFLECIRRNASNPWIRQIHVLVETAVNLNGLVAEHPSLGLPKVTLFPHGRRVTYRDLFTHANRYMPGSRVIIANADIFFDHSLARLQGYDLTGQMLCLSRWDVHADGSSRLFEHPSSQDAWIFDAPVREFPCSFQLGVLGCDNRLAWEAREAGIRLSNPSRSVRANHLHLSGIRRYTERNRINGAAASIRASYLDSPCLWFVVSCRDVLADLQFTFESVSSQPRSSCVLVDCGRAAAVGNWVRERSLRASVVNCEAAAASGAEARNRGAAAVDDDGIICFLDSGISAAPHFAKTVLSSYAAGSYLVPDRDGPGLSTALVCSKADFDRAGGLDETFQDWGEEMLDLRDSLDSMGLTQRRFPETLLAHRPEHREIDHGILDVHAAYRRVKRTMVVETKGTPVSNAARSEIYRAIARGRGIDLPPISPCAAVCFRENMGYTVARLEPGASSHNNDFRPFTAIPEPLAGRLFTQVVACSESPIEVEFLQSGKLYVLVGTDWQGSIAATAWLRESGRYECMPNVRTRRGTGFEVWSLVGQTGDHFVLPTQVMLVADHLEKK